MTKTGRLFGWVSLQTDGAVLQRRARRPARPHRLALGRHHGALCRPSESLAAASSHPATGTDQVEMWQPNATLNAQVCKNDTGGPWAPWQLKRWDIAGGALYNGMVLPYVNM